MTVLLVLVVVYFAVASAPISIRSFGLVPKMRRSERREKIHEQTIALSTKEKPDCFSAQQDEQFGRSSFPLAHTYPQLADVIIEGSPEGLSEADLAKRVRPILDGIYRREIAAWQTLFRQRENNGRATTDIAQAARAATFGAVETILMDIDQVIPGRIDDQGAVSFAQQQGEGNYGLVDEIATRVLAAGGRVIGVRKTDIPREQSIAAVLRYPA
jgi:Bacterial archaeo-eukaryotic release factor family 8